jgi:hypothetical protein
MAVKDLATSETPMLVLVDGESSTRWLLRSERTVVGRDPSSDILIADRQISRRHAEIVRTGGDFVLRDCASKNGTFVNGERVEGDFVLEDGDEIQLALCCRLIFVGAGATAPLGSFLAGGGPLRLDERSHAVWVNGVELDPPLSAAQFRLLTLLWSEPGRVFNRAEVAEAVWPGEESEGITEQAMDALVRRLRERLDAADGADLVETVRGQGFRLDLGGRE